LTEQHQPFSNFEKFDEDELPTNSDVTLILHQYLNCFEKLKKDNITIYGGYWYWVIDGDRSEIMTAPSKKIK